jgi:putative glutamine amidotransferase
MGGTLFQDIEKQNAGRAVFMHRQASPSYSPVHSVAFSRDSKIASCLLGPGELDEGPKGPESGLVSIRVNSFHHQAVKEVAPGFRASAHSGDGIVEAIEPADDGRGTHPFTLGVQWHPERMWKHHAHAKRLFSQFAEACKSVGVRFGPSGRQE